MKSSALIALCLATAACSTPKLPDPRFDWPDAPVDLQKEPERLKTIETTPTENTTNPRG